MVNKKAFPFGEDAERSEADEGSTMSPNRYAARQVLPHLIRQPFGLPLSPKGKASRLRRYFILRNDNYDLLRQLRHHQALR